MKRIIDGKTYNTQTSTKAAEYSWEDDKGFETDSTVYCTRAGSLFIVHETITDREDGNGDTLIKYSAETLSRDDLERLFKHQDMEVIDEESLEPPPEEGDTEATIYLRVSQPLKDRITAKAEAEPASVNSWVTKTLEAASR